MSEPSDVPRAVGPPERYGLLLGHYVIRKRMGEAATHVIVMLN